MTADARPLAYTEVEIHSYLPSGWGIAPNSTGTWSADRSAWQIDVLDGAENTWTVAVDAADAAGSGRLSALKSAIDHLNRKALGRKSILSG
ncbi:MAG TPA: hypothetical protein VGC00_01510 [Thermoanaerobaculia bacterium]|jgi:hypothetical protein